MNITEEQNKEADRIVEKHELINLGVTTTSTAIHHAIQDRQSVLEVVRKAFNRTSSSKGFNHYFDDEIQSLTNQIEYLKTKI